MLLHLTHFPCTSSPSHPLPTPPFCFKGVTLTDLKEAEKTMGRAGDSKTASEQWSKEEENRDKDGEQQSQETTVEVAGSWSG